MRFPALLALLGASLISAPAANRDERVEWFRDAGFGLFIHWSLDSQIGSTISHTLVGASEDYIQRFLQLPRSFNPHKFEPRDWAVLARLAGFRYVVFTAKHHSGFCMFDSATTDFTVMHTPYGRDITAQVLQAFREQGIAPGLYFSPDDFHYLHEHGITINRYTTEASPDSNPGLLRYDQAQIRELLTRYGNIGLLFLDGPARNLRDTAWQLDPNVIVTRGAMETPEQHIPGVPIEGPWESCITMGEAWQYQPTNDHYKSGAELISDLIETRAKGGNLLLNVGPRPDGELPIEQESRLREIALWMFVNGEAIYGVRPWIVTNENEIWFTRRRGEDTLYAFVTGERWKLGEWKEITLHSVKTSAGAQVSVLGQNDKVLEYQPRVVPETTWRQQPDGLHIRAMRAQRLYDDRRWPNPVVLKITHAQPGIVPPRVLTTGAGWDPQTGSATLEGALRSLGNAPAVEVGFQYRPRKGMTDLYEKTAPWSDTAYLRRSAPGEFSLKLSGLEKGREYDYRAVVKHPLLTLYGEEKVFTAR
ncbi:MAG TPA: alpha-L-fucosidase [Bryobacteraceae bacterium]|nr:alpha-L-fucosidase [Bryobacteraceae bacterium]